jgi:hypothetical protein
MYFEPLHLETIGFGNLKICNFFKVFLFLAKFCNSAKIYFRKWKKNQKNVIFRDVLAIFWNVNNKISCIQTLGKIFQGRHL